MAAAGLARGARRDERAGRERGGSPWSIPGRLRPGRRLVQIPCIERNAFGSVTALNAASSPCAVTACTRRSIRIETMRETGADMREIKGNGAGRTSAHVPNAESQW